MKTKTKKGGVTVKPTMRTVLVATYRPEDSEWIKDRRLYNLPLPKCGKVAFHDRISRIVLIAEGFSTVAYSAKLKGVVDRDWLKSEGYKVAPKNTAHGEIYALYELCEKLNAANVLSDASADVFVLSSQRPNVRIDAAFYAKPYPRTGGKSMPYIFDKLKPYFKKWHAACVFNPVRVDFLDLLVNEGKKTLGIRGSKRPIAIDLFAGCGGLSLGFEQAGFDVVAAVEIDPIHAAVHEYNFPYSKTICADIKNVTGAAIREMANLGDRDVDIVFGGAPCQGFSMIGKRALDDPRNKLIGHYLRVVSDIRPKYCVLENVKGLTVGNHVKFLSELIGELKKIHYNVLLPYRVLNAADYGVPQNRQRLFLIAAREDQTLPNYPEAIREKTTIREAIEDLPNADKFKRLLDDDSVAASWKTKQPYAMRLRGLTEDADNFGYMREFDRDQLTASMRTVHTELSRRRFLEAPQGETEPHSRFFKLAWNGQSNTLRAGTDSARGGFTSPRPIHPELPRVITVREGARIHSYPDWFRFHKTKWHGFREIGNSVPPLLARAVGRSVMKALGLNPKKPNVILKPGSESLLGFDMSEAASHFGVSRHVIAQRKRRCDEK